MTQLILVTSVLLLMGMLLLGVRIFFVKGGRFPNTHVGGSKAMKTRGIGCVSSQDRESRQINKNKINVEQL